MKLRECPFCGNESETRGYFWGENMLWGDNIYQGVRIGKEDGLCCLQTEFYDENYHTSINFCPKCGRPLGTENSPNRWISVDDMLPADDEPVIAYIGDGCYDLLTYYHKGDEVYDEIVAPQVRYATVSGFYICESRDGKVYYRRHSDIITHWMPLPEPPKGDS